MLSFRQNDQCFQLRSCAVLIHKGKLLLHRNHDEDFWALPGGRVEWNEPSAETVVRELKEEINFHVKSERLLWVSELLFPWKKTNFHELNFIYLVTLDQELPELNRTEWRGTEEDSNHLIFRWFPIEELDQLPLYPMFLRKGIQNLPAHTTHQVEILDEEV